MTKRFLRFIISVVLLIPFFAFCTAASEEIGPEFILTGKFSSPVSVSIYSPEYIRIGQFGEERTDWLNRILKHISLNVTMDSDISRTTLIIDRDPVISYTVSEKDSIRHTVYSFQPDMLYTETLTNENGTEQDFSSFLDDHFFILNSLIDELYPVFEKSADAFSEFGKPSAASLNFRGYGKGVRKLTIPLSDQYVKDHFPLAAAELAGTTESRDFLNSLIFSGPQKIILLYDQEDRLLRINYDGKVGLSEESIRKVSVVWRCLRTDDMKKDNISIKTPAIQGYDKYNITYERTVDFSDPQHQGISWDLQMDLRAGQLKKKNSYIADIVISDGSLSGELLFTEKQDGGEKKIQIIPELLKENEADCSGTIEITNYSGKIMTSSLKTSVSLSPAERPEMPEYSKLQVAELRETETSEAEDSFRIQLNSILIRKLLELPAEDLLFFSMDIPDDDWNLLIHSII